MLMQLAPLANQVINAIKPVVDQPIIRMPFVMPLAQSQSIGAGLTGQVLTASNFQNALEYPFEIQKIKFSQDPSHTPRDWRVLIRDQIFSMQMGTNPAMVATLIDNNTGAWTWEFPWVMRPKGGAFQIFVDNLDVSNAITVDIDLVGNLLIPTR